MRWVLLFALLLKKTLKLGDVHLFLYSARVEELQYDPSNRSPEPLGLSIGPSLMPSNASMRKLKLRKFKGLIQVNMATK